MTVPTVFFDMPDIFCELWPINDRLRWVTDLRHLSPFDLEMHL